MLELDLKKTLKERLNGATKVAVLGVGSELRADDVAGMLIAKQLDEIRAKDGELTHLDVFYGATAPENLTGEIKKCQPSHLVIIDAADTGSEPGTIMFIDPDTLIGVSFSTHMMPLNMMVDYLRESFKCTVVVIGVQPKVLEFGKPVSPEIQETVKQLATALAETLKKPS